ncbi:mannan endo-16-alpha-mannosidase DCW1 protein [Rutstroemia sp. NJR-2017a BVV2]|nr:mannan endo-16-alpha-mannosidase DCW1 protein [Rutstroemia sp. NJR-2017a BVV2]
MWYIISTSSKMVSTKTLVALAAFSLASVQGLDLDISDSKSIKNAAATIAKQLVKEYNVSEPGHPIGVLSIPGRPYYWWESAAMFDTLIKYWSLTGDDQFNNIVTDGMIAQQGEHNDFMPLNWTASEGNDDQSFWALAAMSAAESKLPKPQNGSWIDLADAVFNEQVLRWDDETCGGGLRWQIFSFNTGYSWKNSLTNANFFQLASRLAAYTGNSTYSEWASKAYNWTTSVGFVTSDGTVYDGADVSKNCSTISKVQSSDKAGSFIAGAAYMYNVTKGSEQWKNTLNNLLLANIETFFSNGVAIESECEPQNRCTTDQLAFKGLLGQALVETLKVAPYTEGMIIASLQSSAKAAAKACTDSGCAFVWDGSAQNSTSGVGEKIDALSFVQGLLYKDAAAPATNATSTSGGSGTKSGSSAATTTSSTAAEASKNAAASTVMMSSGAVMSLFGAVAWMVL